MKVVNSEQQLLLYQHLLEVFHPKSVEDILGVAKTLEGEEGEIKRRRLIEEQEWLLPLWESSLHPNLNGQHEFDVFPTWGDIQASKWKGRIQIFFAFLPSHYLKSLTCLNLTSPSSSSQEMVLPQMSFAWKEETPLAYLELDTDGNCQKAEVSPLLCALMALSRELLNQEPWDPRQWFKDAHIESVSIEQEYQRLYSKDSLCFQSEFLQPFLKRWSDRLQGLKDLGPFPFFQGWMGIRLSPSLYSPSLTSYFEESLQELWETPIDEGTRQEGGFSLSPALEQSLQFSFLSPSSPVNMALHPRKMGWGGAIDGLNIGEQWVFTKIKDTLNQPGFLKLSRPLGTQTIPVLQELIGDAWVERAVRLSKLSSPEEGLSPLDPQLSHLQIPIDALIEHGTFLWVGCENPSSLDTLLPELNLFSPSWLFENKIRHCPHHWNIHHLISHLPNWLKETSEKDSSEEISWEKAKHEFLQAKKGVEEHLYELTRSIRWVQDWGQVSSREIELDMDHQTKSEYVEQMKRDHVSRFEKLRDAHQQSKREMQVLEKDLSRFVEQISKMKDKLSQEKPISKMDKALSWLGIQTSYVKQISEQRKERLLILKRARKDRELCREQLDKIKKHVRKTMREIEELKISHIEKQEVLELELATLEREKDEVEARVQKLARHRHDYPSHIEEVWDFWKESIDKYDSHVLTSNPWDDLPTNWLKDWTQKRHRLVVAACQLHTSVLNAWKPHIENLMPWFEKWQKQESLKPEIIQKLWNVLGLWMPLQRCSVSQAFRLSQNLPKQTIGWLWMDEEVLNHSSFSVLLQKSNKAIELKDPIIQTPNPFYASWLQDKLKVSTQEWMDKTPLHLDFHLQTQSASPWFELSNEYLYEEKLVNQTEGEISGLLSQWICVNPHTRIRHQGQGPIDEWAWLNKKTKEWKRQWPQLSLDLMKDATLQICVLKEEWKKIVKDILDEVKLSDKILISSLRFPPIKTDWAIFVLGSFEENINLHEVVEKLKVQAILRPRYALSILGDPNTWPIHNELPWLHTLPWVEEKCVVSGVLKEKALGHLSIQENAPSSPVVQELQNGFSEDVWYMEENDSENVLNLPQESLSFIVDEAGLSKNKALSNSVSDFTPEDSERENPEPGNGKVEVEEMEYQRDEHIQDYTSPLIFDIPTKDQEKDLDLFKNTSLSTPSFDHNTVDSDNKDEKESHSQAKSDQAKSDQAKSDLDELFASWEDE